MKIRVNPHTVEIVKEQTEPINEREIKVSKCEFEFDEAITSDFVKEAYFTLNGNTYKMIVENNECDYPSEVLTEKGTLEIGAVAFKVENGEEIVRYNPSPDYFESWVGSLKDAENSEPITPSEMEQFEQELQKGLNDIQEAVENAEKLDIDASKVGKITSITITKQDGTTKTVTLEDGMGLNYKWLGTSLGIKREDEQEYVYVDLQGPRGEAGAIKMLIVATLPTTGSDDTIYLVPLETPTEEGNNYAEYVYINGEWELLGKIGVHVDLTDYVKNTDYATSSKGGVLKIRTQFGINLTDGVLLGTTKSYQDYSSNYRAMIISGGTLENVFAGKGFITNQVSDLANYYNKTYIDALVGDINTALDTINGEVVGGA